MIDLAYSRLYTAFMPNLKEGIFTKLLGKAIRSIENSDSLYLSFDDGPDPTLTPHVLDLLKKHNAKATFFVIAVKAKNHKDIIERIQKEGHSIGNHSLDHSYSQFFKGYKAMKNWILQSESMLRELDIKSVGFRPPVGIRTPELAKALRELNLPLILWEQRCYDGVFKFSKEKALKLAKQCKAGDIVLFHDVQKPQNQKVFLDSLSLFLEKTSQIGATPLSPQHF